jgi:hypothetical protein
VPVARSADQHSGRPSNSKVPLPVPLAGGDRTLAGGCRKGANREQRCPVSPAQAARSISLLIGPLNTSGCGLVHTRSRSGAAGIPAQSRARLRKSGRRFRRASCCEQVTEERLDAVITKLRPLILTTANDSPDAQSANERFSVAIDAGRTAAESGKIDPEDAEEALREMETELST